MKMTNVLTMFRFRRWDAEKKTKMFVRTLNLLFVAFFALAVFTTWTLTGIDTTYGIVAAVVLFLLVVAFDLVNRASIYLSTDRANFLRYKNNFDSQAETSRRIAVNELNELKVDYDEFVQKMDTLRSEVELLNTLINKKRKGKKMRLPKDVKACLASINQTI